jgi:hypothetical protein
VAASPAFLLVTEAITLEDVARQASSSICDGGGQSGSDPVCANGWDGSAGDEERDALQESISAFHDARFRICGFVLILLSGLRLLGTAALGRCRTGLERNSRY